jgi:hypothetical protein
VRTRRNQRGRNLSPSFSSESFSLDVGTCLVHVIRHLRRDGARCKQSHTQSAAWTTMKQLAPIIIVLLLTTWGVVAVTKQKGVVRADIYNIIPPPSSF